MLLAKIVAILCAHPHITANSVTEITQSEVVNKNWPPS